MPKPKQPEDMPNVLKVRVTADDILRGVRSNDKKCAIARACKKQYGDHPTVSAESIGFMFRGGFVYYAGTKKAEKFIEKFDSDGKKSVKPTTFTFRRREV